jgi:xylan 1,4-beta-xylosidase
MTTRTTTLTAAVVLSAVFTLAPQQTADRQTIAIDAKATGRPFPHFWERMFGSGRAILALRDDYRRDLRAVREITGVQYIRFHHILGDEVGVYSEDASGTPVHNFNYVDQIYDGLLDNGTRPFIELSFMPAALSVSQKPHAFWYRPLPNPPRSYDRWGELIYAFAQHLVQRYGLDEVSQWYFEVWNEPNIDFWTGEPKQATYWELYDAAAQAVKRVSPRLRVGGPATAQAAWVDAFIAHCASKNIPADFASTHVYANDRSEDVFGTKESIPRSDMVARSVKKVFDQVKRSERPNLPIIWSEYNASYMNEPAVTDAPFMGPWLANTIRQSDGMVDTMSYWTFSDVFEEQGVYKTPFYGGFGLIAAGGIPKPAYNAFAMLHRLGTERLMVSSSSAVVTRRSDGSLAIALWNYADPGKDGPPRTTTLEISNADGLRSARIQVVDPDHGNALQLWNKMGAPISPTRDQIVKLRQAGVVGEPEKRALTGGRLDITLAPHALALIEVTR